MTTFNFTREIDTNGSSVFRQIFFNEDTNSVALVFNNGTVVTRELYFENPEDIDSWGQYWNTTLKFQNGETFHNGVTFVQQVTSSGESSDSHAAKYGLDQNALNAALDTFYNVYDDDDEAVAAAISAYFSALPATEQPSENDGVDIVADDLDEPDFVDEEMFEFGATISSDSTISAGSISIDSVDDSKFVVNDSLAAALGSTNTGNVVIVAYLDVDDEIVHKVTSLANSFDEFIREQVGDVKSIVQRYNVSEVYGTFFGGNK